MYRLVPPLLLLSLLFGPVGCTVHRHYGRPYAYGVHPTDWVIEEQAQSCAASCDPLRGDARFACMSGCPGFVTAQVATCRDVPDWHECKIGYETPQAIKHNTPEQPKAGNQVGTALAVGTVRVLGALITAALQDGDDDDDDDSKKSATHPLKKSKKSATHPLKKSKNHATERGRSSSDHRGIKTQNGPKKSVSSKKDKRPFSRNGQ